MVKYIDLINLVIHVQIGDILVPNVLIYLGSTISVMKRKILDQLGLFHFLSTPTLIENADISKINPKDVLDDVVVSIDSWEYPTYLLCFSQKIMLVDIPWFWVDHGLPQLVLIFDVTLVICIFPMETLGRNSLCIHLLDPFKSFDITYGYIMI